MNSAPNKEKDFLLCSELRSRSLKKVDCTSIFTVSGSFAHLFERTCCDFVPASCMAGYGVGESFCVSEQQSFQAI
jgi:hypothetical protein